MSMRSLLLAVLIILHVVIILTIFKLLMPQSCTDVRKYFFACRIVRCWNSLDAEPEHVSSLTAFKKFLQQIYVV